MAYRYTVAQYLNALQKEYRSALSDGQHTAELSYRPILDAFFRNLAKDFAPNGNIDVVLEPRSQGKIGRPDWRIHDRSTLGVCGYVEAKGLTDQPFDMTTYQAQINRYLSLHHKLILTDGIDFVFCMEEKKEPVFLSLIDKSMLSAQDWSRLPIADAFELSMREFFANPSAWQCEEEKLVEFAALRTRRLADRLAYYAALSYEEAMNEEERQVILLLNDVKVLLEQQNAVKLQGERELADFIAQLLMFGVFYGHRVVCSCTDLPTEREEKLRNWFFKVSQEKEEVSLLQNMQGLLYQRTENGSFISDWLEECIRFFSYVELTPAQIQNPNYQKLFEWFFQKYDTQTRFDYGAYYTPDILAGFVVALTEQVIQVELGQSLFADGNFILDACCGTGSFFEQIVLQDKQNGAYTLCGMERMPVPYMLARCRMAVLGRQQKRYTSKLFLTNSLSNPVLSEGETAEFLKAGQCCLPEGISDRLTIVMGNPPCSDSVRKNISEEFSDINALLEDFRPPMELRKARQNIQKQISNPYMQFLRWGCEYVVHARNAGVLSFLVPLSFLEAETYRYARKYIAEHFSGIWVTAVDADSRTGVRSDSMFKTLQGRAVLVLTRAAKQSKCASCYHFLDLSHLDRKTKEKWLWEEPKWILQQFLTHPVQEGNYSFVPAKAFPKALYEQFWPVSGEDGQNAVFRHHCSGIKLAPTALFTHIKQPMLKRRSKEIAADGKKAAAEWLSKQDRPPKEEKVEAFQSALCSCGTVQSMDRLLSEYAKPYSFRPFVTSYVLMWKDLLHTYAQIGGGGTRLRPELLTAYEQEETIGFAMAHAPKDLNPTLTQFVSFCWYYPDNDMCTRGNSHIYLNQFPDKQTGKIHTNINPILLGKLEQEYGIAGAVLAKEVVFYTFAVLCSQVYLDTFEGALFTTNQSDNRARVPFVTDKTVFLQLAALGRELAELERVEYIPENVLQLDYEGLITQLPAGFRLVNALQPFDEERELLLLSDGVTEIPIPCPLSLQKKNISGYDVIKNAWLKFHSYAFTHCEFTKEDLISLLHLMNTLAVHEQLVAQTDELVYHIMQEKYGFLSDKDSE